MRALEQGACPPVGASATARRRDASATQKRLLDHCSKVDHWPVDQCTDESPKPSAALGSIGLLPQDIVLTEGSYPTYSGRCVGACAFAQAENGNPVHKPGLPRSGRRERTPRWHWPTGREAVDIRKPGSPGRLVSPKTCQYPAPGSHPALGDLELPRGRRSGDPFANRALPDREPSPCRLFRATRFWSGVSAAR